jgi:ribonuclease HI
MATGYTWPVRDGSVTTLRDFALRCSGLIGYAIASIEETVSWRFYEAVDDARTTSEKYNKMTLAEAVEQAKKIAAESALILADSSAKRKEAQERYAAMRAKVEAWKPPTPNHEVFKGVMLDELDRSIQNDCSVTTTFESAPPIDVEKWLDEQRQLHRAGLVEAEERLAEEKRIVAQMNAWNKALVASLEGL